jgi:hypothetical protein
MKPRKRKMAGAGSSMAAKKEEATAAIMVAVAPSGQEVSRQKAVIARIVTKIPAAERAAMSWSRWGAGGGRGEISQGASRCQRARDSAIRIPTSRSRESNVSQRGDRRPWRGG